MYDIITLGSADVDLFVKTKVKPEIRRHLSHKDVAYHLGAKLLVDELDITTGGGGTNTAVAFSRLGLKTGFIGVIGDDISGKKILKELKDEKVDFLGSVKKGDTGVSVILPSESDRTILVYKGIGNKLTIRDIKISKIRAKWLYVSSMLGQSLETAEKIIRMVKKRKTKVALNFSSYLASRGLDELSPMLHSADVLILNREEAELLTRKRGLSDIFQEIYKYTYAIVAITSGSGDIYVFDGLDLYVKRVHPIQPVDRTGAGDAFSAGFIYGLIKNKPIEKALDYGYKEAKSVLMHVGAKNNLLRRL